MRLGGKALAATAGLIVAVGTVVRILLVLHTDHDPFDVHAQQVIAGDLLHHWRTVYGHQVPGPLHTGINFWPYPPGYFPVLLLVRGLGGAGSAFRAWTAAPNVLADAAAAVLVGWVLHRRGDSDARVLAGVALVALNPVLVVVTGAMSQVDGLWVVATALATVLWDRDVARRWVWCGLLIGVAAAMKAVPIFALVALWPTARGTAERLRLTALAVAVPVAASLPFLATQSSAMVHALLGNHSLPGVAGWSLLAQPALHHVWLDYTRIAAGATVTHLGDVQQLLSAVAALAVGAVLWRRRVPATTGAAVVWVAVLAVAPNLGVTYLVWAIVPLLVADRLGFAALLSVHGGFLTVELVLLTPHPALETLYVPVAVALSALMLLWVCRELVSGPDRVVAPAVGAPAPAG